MDSTSREIHAVERELRSWSGAWMQLYAKLRGCHGGTTVTLTVLRVHVLIRPEAELVEQCFGLSKKCGNVENDSETIRRLDVPVLGLRRVQSPIRICLEGEIQTYTVQTMPASDTSLFSIVTYLISKQLSNRIADTPFTAFIASRASS